MPGSWSDAHLSEQEFALPYHWSVSYANMMEAHPDKPNSMHLAEL
jgi:hypothetical protein